MASNKNPARAGSGKEELGLFFGDFDQEECNKYFKRIRAVQFAKLASKEDGNEVSSSSSLPIDPVKGEQLAKYVESMKVNVPADSDIMDVDTSESQPPELSKDCEDDTTSKVFFGKALSNEGKEKGTSEEDKAPEMSDVSLTEGPPAPKVVSSWAALFKSKSDVPVSKGPPIVSVNYPEAATKPVMTNASKMENDKPSSIVPVENDQNALALADFLHKSTLHAGNATLQLRGLINNGNWCYINATLQSLLGCSSFYSLFKTMNSVKPKSAKPSSTPLTDTMMDFASEFSTIDLKGITNKGKKSDDLRLGDSFEPKRVYDILSILKFTLSESGRQQDAEEFLTFLLNGLHDEFMSLSKLINNAGKVNHVITSDENALVNGNTHNSNPSESHDVTHNSNLSESHDVDISDENAVDDTWEQVGRNNKSANLRKAPTNETFITSLFGGILRSSVHHAGAKESAMLQPFFTIQLDIQGENIWNIKDAFENYFTKESIEGFTSSKTNSKVEASHKTSLEKLPQVLILHLKYFVYDKAGGCQKTHKHVEISRELEIPRDVLSYNLKGRIPSNQRTYELFAVEFHLGKHAAGGHYTTAVKHRDPIGWVYCNDSIIQKTHFNQVTKQQKDKVPYLLFYERIGHFGK